MDNLPSNLEKLSKTTLTRMHLVPAGTALMLIDLNDPISRNSLSLYGSTTELNSSRKYGVEIRPKGRIKLSYSVSQARDRGRTLDAEFSRRLIRETLQGKDKQYEVHCGTIPSGRCGMPQEAYLLDIRSDLTLAFNFAAQRLLQLANYKVPKSEATKLGAFILEDYRTRKHTEKSHQVGMEADSIFISPPRNN